MSNRQIEYRTYRSAVSLREGEGIDASTPKCLVGYAATFGNPSQDLGGYVEVLAPGCFGNSLASGDIRAFYNHCYEHLLGRTKSGTLRLVEDATGLSFEIDMPETGLGHDVYELVRRGDIDGVSFGFFSIRDEWSEDGLTNTILEAELIEISPVVFPAYLSTSVEARSLDRLARRPKQRFRTLDRVKIIVALDDED